MGKKGIYLAAVISAFMLLDSTCLGLENQIINGEFDTGIGRWQRSDGDGFNIEIIQDAGLSRTNAIKIDVLDAAVQESIIISQGIFVLERGATYHIGFTAKADADRQIGVLFEQNGTWADTWYEWIDLTPSPQTFSFEYRLKQGWDTTQGISLLFVLKHSLFPLINENENIDVYIDSVYVVQEPPVDPNLAHHPDPPVGTIHDDLWAILYWTPGQYATSHDVYIGNNFDDVNNGTGNTFWGDYSERYVIIGFPDYADRSRGVVVPGATIYWRVDEVNDIHPDSPWKGDVWSFMIQPQTAYNPDPSDGAELIDPNVTISWTAGFHAKLHTIYFGDNFDDVNCATGELPQQSTTYSSGPLEFDKTYYWRIDEFDGTDTHIGQTWSFSTKPVKPNIAHDPYPTDGAMHPDTWATLSWSPGLHAASHDVYFGENYEDVNEGIIDTFRGNQTDMFFLVGFIVCFGPPLDILPGNTYYWRIDEVNDLHPDSPWKGNVWSFGIPPYTAYNPIPADGVEQIDPNVTLSWKAGLHAELHTIYFGDNFDDVNEATEGLPQETTTYTPGPLELDKTYYWRIDELSWSGMHKGEVWSFSTKPAGPNIAYDPYPADGAELIDPNVTLSRTAGFGAKLHTLYFGEDFADVEAGTGGTFKGSYSQTNYLPDLLDFDKTYYWRIDEFDGAATHKGQIWSFTTASAVFIRGGNCSGSSGGNSQ